jgi:hypothetical protein
MSVGSLHHDDNGKLRLSLSPDETATPSSRTPDWHIDTHPVQRYGQKMSFIPSESSIPHIPPVATLRNVRFIHTVYTWFLVQTAFLSANKSNWWIFVVVVIVAYEGGRRTYCWGTIIRDWLVIFIALWLFVSYTFIDWTLYEEIQNRIALNSIITKTMHEFYFLFLPYLLMPYMFRACVKHIFKRHCVQILYSYNLTGTLTPYLGD